jgi:hypothetical protein
MRRAITIALLCIIIQEGKAQTYFSKRFNLFNKSNATLNIKCYNDTFYVPTQIEETPIPQLSYSSGLIKISPQGIVVNEKKIKNANQYYTSSIDVIKLNNYYYQYGNTGAGTQVLGSLIKFNESGDTLKTMTFGDTSFYNYANKIIIKNKKELLLIGVTDSSCGTSPSGLYKIIIRTMDTNMVLKATKILNSTCEYRTVVGAELDGQGGYLLSYASTFGTWGFENRLLRLDSNLNIVWDKKIAETSGGYAGIVNHEGNYYKHATTKVDSVWNFSYKWERPCLSHINKNGTIKWQKSYGVKQREISTTGLKECANGDFILSGTRKTTNNIIEGWLMRTDSLGNQKWWRGYNTLTQDATVENYIYDLQLMSNGDIVTVGWVGSNVNLPAQQTWVLKVDSNGCLGANNCPPSIANGTNSVEELSEASTTVNVYPNPFNDELKINVNAPFNTKNNFSVEIIETASSVVLLQQPVSNSSVTLVNTSGLANGLYIVRVKGGTHFNYYTKLIKLN